MKKAGITILVLLICVLLAACGKPAAESAPEPMAEEEGSDMA